VIRADGTSEVVPSKMRLTLRAGDVLRVLSAGGGGYGNPAERPAKAVLADVLDRKVSVEAARAEYGVAIENGRIDEDDTRRLRDTRRERGDNLVYDRGEVGA
jgi:N-methylhydantoinase B/oxoprolinase/acetone carboxylase alpha subunit